MKPFKWVAGFPLTLAVFLLHWLFSLNYLFSCPQWARLQNGRRKELHVPHFVCESSVHQFHVLLPGEKATSNGHVCTRNHVILDQSRQWLAILQTKTDKWRMKINFKSHSNSWSSAWRLPISHSLAWQPCLWASACASHLESKLPPKAHAQGFQIGFYLCHLPTVLYQNCFKLIYSLQAFSPQFHLVLVTPAYFGIYA